VQNIDMNRCQYSATETTTSAGR